MTYKKSDLKLIPGGDPIGIKINTGVYVINTYGVETKNGKKSPAKDAGISSGDKLISIDNVKIEKIEDINIDYLTKKASKNESVVIKYLHGSKVQTEKITPVLSKNNVPTLGMYLRDKIVGIGTLTYIIPYTNSFGALGHQIEDEMLSLRSEQANGDLNEATITGIQKSRNGVPGAKKASISTNKIGVINKNTISGIFGKIENSKDFTNSYKRYSIGTRDDVKEGKATILTSIDGKKVEEFDILITEVNSQKSQNIKGIKIKIVDRRLIKETGGIVQGMSGSPIIQNNRIIGAVTHVTVDNTVVGYGIYIEWMLEENGIKVVD